MIYLDSAATSYYRPDTVARAVGEAINTFGNAGRGAHEGALCASRVIYDTRGLLAELFHAPAPEQVVFSQNSTQALNTAIRGFCRHQQKEKGQLSLATTAMEHNSVLRPLYQMEEEGHRLTILPMDSRGRIALQQLEELLKTGVDLFCCTHVSNVTGNVNDLQAIGKLCRQYNTTFLVDASQSAGTFSIDMERDAIDILCFTGHKGLMGPQGTGGLCLAKGIEIDNIMAGGSGIHSFLKEQPRELPTLLEWGTLNAHGIAGLNAALLYIREVGNKALLKKEQLLSRRFYDGVKDIPGIICYGDFPTEDRGPIVSLNLEGIDSGRVSDALAEEYQIYTRPGAHCAPLVHEHFKTVNQGMVRFSFSHFLTEDEIDFAIDAVRTLALE